MPDSTTDHLTGRRIFRLVSRLGLPLLARIRVTGVENVPTRGPLLVLANHLSTIDAPLLILALSRSNLPFEQVYFVGPADFKLLFPANLIVEWTGTIRVKRSTKPDLSSLKRMTELLKQSAAIGMFPEGGTWEKALTDAKPGAAYLSMTTGASVLPIGLGGTYRVWYAISRLRRPPITINIGEVIPPLAPPAQRSGREAALQAYTDTIMQRIYSLLPLSDQARYDDWAARRYSMIVSVNRNGVAETLGIAGSAALGEVIQKPNLISPFIQNAKLPLAPFTDHGQAHTAAAVKTAAESWQAALQTDFADYFEYRLGAEKATSILSALAALIDIAASPGVDSITFHPRSER